MAVSMAPWRSPLAHALHRNRSLPYARYFQLSTVRPDGRPANRTVVFRGFLEESDRLQVVTDLRSEKIDHMAHQPWGEICWYFPKTREQFRLLGSLALVTHASPEDGLMAARHTLWQNLSDSGRSQFVWPHPGKPRTSAEAFGAIAPNPSFPPDSFCLLLLDPHQVDHLELRGNPQDRTVYQRIPDDTWTTQAVNP